MKFLKGDNFVKNNLKDPQAFANYSLLSGSEYIQKQNIDFIEQKKVEYKIEQLTEEDKEIFDDDDYEWDD